MTSQQIKEWLALVASARLAVAQAQQRVADVAGVDKWELNQAAEYLETAFLAGLDAHGKALLIEHLAAESKATAA